MPLFSDIAEQPCFMRWLRNRAARSAVRVGAPQRPWRSGRPRRRGEFAVRRTIMPEEEMRMYRFALAVLVCAAALPSPSRAQSYPSKPIHFILPYVPGGIIDTAGRHLAL